MSLCANDVSLTLAGATVISRLDMQLEPGKIVTISGPNGAGKSSLLRLLTGEWRPSNGDVWMDNSPIEQRSIGDIAQTLAVMPQSSSLNFAFTCEEVVGLGRTPHATGATADREITLQALTSVDAIQLAKRLYTELSGGEKQRVQLARVLAQVWQVVPGKPRYLLLDEPTASFDLSHQRLTLEVLRRLAGDGVGILVVVHDLNLAAQLAHTMVLMKDGQIISADEPANVMQSSLIREVFDVDVSIVNHPRHGHPTALM